jgi:serine/threonine protein kinase
MSSEADDASDDASGMRSAPRTGRDTFDEATGTRSSVPSDARRSHALFDESGSTTRPRPPAGQTSESLPDLPPHLQIRKVLGQGGTAVVYEALHTRLNVRVAVKVLAAGSPHEAEGRERLLREAELYARLSDPRFPRVYDVDELPDGTPFVVMEFIEGKTLAEVLMFGPLELELVYVIAREILEALIEIHQVGIVHRDIKPSNILLEGAEGEEMRVRLVDFGIAKSVLKGPSDSQLTQQGTMLGTPHYMAPEQITAQELDERVDIYAVGVVLYELLSGRMPFDGPTVGEVIAAAARRWRVSAKNVLPRRTTCFVRSMLRAPRPTATHCRSCLPKHPSTWRLRQKRRLRHKRQPWAGASTRC